MIKEIYGNYNLWAWVRYWYIDSVVKQTIMMMDKTRVDYSKKGETKRKIKDKKQEKELAEFNRMLGERYLSDEEKAEKIRKEKELKNNLK